MTTYENVRCDKCSWYDEENEMCLDCNKPIDEVSDDDCALNEEV